MFASSGHISENLFTNFRNSITYSAANSTTFIDGNEIEISKYFDPSDIFSETSAQLHF